MEVEASGAGFDSAGRVRMLFEPHIFYRETAGAARAAAVKAGLAWPTWRREYPKDSYPRLIAAMAIDRDAALRSASWGLGQIMGFNCIAAGFDSADGMVRAFAADEETQLAAMVRFIKARGLDDELRHHDWAGFARGYNGAGYAANGYHTKLAVAYAKWAGIRDTPMPTVQRNVGQVLPERGDAAIGTVTPAFPVGDAVGPKTNFSVSTARSWWAAFFATLGMSKG
jgi:hypothetical protein